MPVPPKFLRCTVCARRKKPCNVTLEQACTWCVTRQVACRVMTHEEISKRENETSELQIQVNRLEAILSRCVDVKGKARQATREYEEEDEEEKEDAPIDVRLEETIYSLGRLCVASHPSEVATPPGLRGNALFAEARRAFADISIASAPTLLPHTGFTLASDLPNNHASLIAYMPSNVEVEKLLLTGPGQQYVNQFQMIYGPAYAEEVEKMYETIERGDQPRPAQLASLLAFVMWLARAEESRLGEAAEGRDGERSDPLAKKVLLALELDTEGPSVDSIRAFVCVIFQLFFGHVGYRHALAFKLLTEAVSQSHEIGLFDEERHRNESLLELSSRRALGSLLLQVDGLQRLHFGRHSIQTTFLAPEPFYLEDEELTIRQQHSMLRASRVIVDFVRFVHRVSLIGRQVGRLTFGYDQRRGDIDQALDDIAALEANGLLPNLADGRPHTDEDGFAFGAGSLYTVYLRARLHHLIASGNAALEEDMDHHRQALLRSISMIADMLAAMQMINAETATVLLIAPSTVMLDYLMPVVLGAYLQGLYSDSALAARLRQEAMRCLESILACPNPPVALIRYNHLLSLLERMPRSVATASIGEGEVATKRSRLDHLVASTSARSRSSTSTSSRTLSTSSSATPSTVVFSPLFNDHIPRWDSYDGVVKSEGLGAADGMVVSPHAKRPHPHS